MTTMPEPYCRAQKDGDCIYSHCPQIKDNEPFKTGRHCPLDVYTDDDGVIESKNNCEQSVNPLAQYSSHDLELDLKRRRNDNKYGYFFWRETDDVEVAIVSKKHWNIFKAVADSYEYVILSHKFKEVIDNIYLFDGTEEECRIELSKLGIEELKKC